MVDVDQPSTRDGPSNTIHPRRSGQFLFNQRSAPTDLTSGAEASFRGGRCGWPSTATAVVQSGGRSPRRRYWQARAWCWRIRRQRDQCMTRSVQVSGAEARVARVVGSRCCSAESAVLGWVEAPPALRLRNGNRDGVGRAAAMRARSPPAVMGSGTSPSW